MFITTLYGHTVQTSSAKTLSGRALGKDLGKYQDDIKDIELTNYKVRILNGGTEAVTRVLIVYKLMKNRGQAGLVAGKGGTSCETLS
jgi:hypothetical protein